MVFGALPPLAVRDRVVLALPGEEARASWESIVTEHAPDVVVLDDVTSGEDLGALTSAAGMGRLVLARTDWGDSFALLEQLASRPHGRSAAARRLQLILQQRLLPPGSGGEPGPRIRTEVLVISDVMRATLRAGASAAALRQLALAEGFRDLATSLEAEVRAGRLDAALAARALAV